jgi:hypothetical protein
MRHGVPSLVGSALGASLALALAGAACSTGRDVPNNLFEDDSGARPDGPLLVDAGPVLFDPDGASDGVASCPAHCSGDLHSVIDCHGTILSTCPDTQGCDPVTGGCIPACDSAKANKGSIGCEFYAVEPDHNGGTTGSCYAAFVANTWNGPVTLSGDFKGSPLNMAAIARIPAGSGSAITYTPLTGNQIPAGQVAIVFLGGSQGAAPNCPIASGGAAPNVNGTSRGNAVHLVADRPVAAYDIYPYGGGTSAITSASLLLPTSAWDTNYVGVSAFDVSAVTSSNGALHLVAAEDGTSITILPSENITAGAGVVAATKNVAQTYSLNKGEQILFSQKALLNGSAIQSTKPIGMWASMGCFNVPVSVPYCDSAHQQIPPVKALGSEYALVRYRNRVATAAEETPPWRIMGLVDGTTLTWEPSTPSGAPTTLNAGQLVTFQGAGPYLVKSQDEKHPLYVSAHMTGCSTVGSIGGAPLGCVGDAEYVNVVPAKEFQSSYVFFTDPTYPESNLVIVRAKGADAAFHDVKLDCAPALGGWQPVGSKGEYEYTRFDLVRNNFEKQGACDNGRHEIKSDAPFGVTIWGWGTLLTPSFYTQAVSYAYPGGMSLKAINTVVIPPIPK